MNGNFDGIVNSNLFHKLHGSPNGHLHGIPLQYMAMDHDGVEPMRVDTPPAENDNEDTLFVVENPSIDLEAYADRYTGLALLYRLIFIMDHCPSLRLEALKIAISNVMQTYNVNLYQRLVKNENVQNGTISSPVLNDVWIETTLEESALKLEKMDHDLRTCRANSIKESIHRCHDELGHHYLNKGELTNALNCYLRAQDYCSSGKLVVNMCLNVIKVSIYMRNWPHVLNFVAKAEGTPEFSKAQAKEKNPIIFTKLRCAAGLAELSFRHFKKAAKNFMQASFEHCNFPDMLSPADVAIYGGLCALATFDRSELQQDVVSIGSFKPFLELEPALRDAIFKFSESRYTACLKILDDMKDTLLLDLYLSPYVSDLYALIRTRALVQYFSPYMSADLRRMAQIFGRTVPALEDELMALILEGQIHARIDSHNKVLYARNVDQREATFARTFAVGKEHFRRVQMMLLRAAMIKSRILVQSEEKQSLMQAS